MRSPAFEPRQQLRRPRRLVVLVVRQQPRIDAVPLEQAARVPRVLAQDDVGRAQLREHAQRDVLEIPDRRRADDERHYESSRSNVATSRQCSLWTCSSRTADSARVPQRQPRSERRGFGVVELLGLRDGEVRDDVRELAAVRRVAREPARRGRSSCSRNGADGSGASQRMPGKRSSRRERRRRMPRSPRAPLRCRQRRRATDRATSRAAACRATASRRHVRSSQIRRRRRAGRGTGRRARARSRPLVEAASNATKPAPMSPAAVPSSACATRTTSRIGRSASRRITSSAGGIRYSQPATPKPPPITISSRREDVRERAHAGAEMPADVGEDLARGLVALVREPDQPVRVRRRAERLLCARGRGQPGHVRLEMTAPAARALARPAVVDDHDVAELDALAVGAAERTAARDHAAAEAGAEREHHEVVVPAPDTGTPLADRRGVRVVVETDRQAEPLRHVIDEARSRRAAGSRTRRRRRRAGRSATARRTDRADLVRQQLGNGGLELADDRCLRILRRRAFVPADDLPLARDDAGEDFRAADVDPDRDAWRSCPAGTVTRRMAASGEKPYRVYKGGRTKGKVPLPSRERGTGGSGGGPDKPGRTVYRSGGGGDERPPSSAGRSAGWTWKRWTWVLARRALRPPHHLVGRRLPLGARAASRTRTSGCRPERLPVLAKQNSLLLSVGTNILLLGTDHSTNGQPGRSSDQHSDSMMLLHTDPSRHRLVYLSIPRDLRATIPGYGDAEDQRRDADRRPEARDRDGRRALRLPAAGSTTSSSSTWARSSVADRRGRRHRREHRRRTSSPTSSTARTRRRAARAGRAGASTRASST